MEHKKRKQVYEVLLKPIVCNKKNKKIYLEDNIIFSGQSYYSSPDADMSNIAVGFYEIIYKDLLNGSNLLNHDNRLLSTDFAGDTMNSFNTLANKTPGVGKSQKNRTPFEKWPSFLQDYYKSYHCLANFWILPMNMGRTTRGWLNKATNPTKDYMDRFLKLVNNEVNFHESKDSYFSKFSSWEDFIKTHFLEISYVDYRFEVKEFSKEELESHTIIENIMYNIEQRAKAISESKYSQELWYFFSDLGFLIDSFLREKY